MQCKLKTLLRSYLSVTTFYNFEKIKESVGKTFFKKLEYNALRLSDVCFFPLKIKTQKANSRKAVLAAVAYDNLNTKRKKIK